MGRSFSEPLTIVLPVRPRSKKNSSRWVRVGKSDIWKLIPSEAYKQYEKDCGPFIRCKGLKIDCRVSIKALFYIDADRECDISNYFEAVADMLVHYHVLKDDNRKIVNDWDGSRMYVDRNNPRTEITITPLPIENEQLDLGIEIPEDDF